VDDALAAAGSPVKGSDTSSPSDDDEGEVAAHGVKSRLLSSLADPVMRNPHGVRPGGRGSEDDALNSTVAGVFSPHVRLTSASSAALGSDAE
jgi:hypothetical protein